MNTAAIKNAAIAKAKSAVSSTSTASNGNAANGGASKKRRGNNQLKPIITNESGGEKDRATSAASTNSNMNKYVIPSYPSRAGRRSCSAVSGAAERS